MMISSRMRKKRAENNPDRSEYGIEKRQCIQIDMLSLFCELSGFILQSGRSSVPGRQTAYPFTTPTVFNCFTGMTRSF